MKSGYYNTKTKVEQRGKIDKQALKKAIEEKPDAYLRELAEPFGVTPQSVFNCLKNMFGVKVEDIKRGKKFQPLAFQIIKLKNYTSKELEQRSVYSELFL